MPTPPKKFSFSLDTWAVILSLALALLVRTNIIRAVSW